MLDWRMAHGPTKNTQATPVRRPMARHGAAAFSTEARALLFRPTPSSEAVSNGKTPAVSNGPGSAAPSLSVQ